MLSESLMEPEEKLKELFPELKKLEINTQINFGEDDELHLLRIPRDVDPQVLLNLDLDIYEKGKFKLGENEKYVIQPTPSSAKHTLVLASESKVVDFKSNIVMAKYVKVKKDPVMFKSEKKVMSLQKSKKRHPLFGSNFEEKVELPKEIQEKLDSVLEYIVKQDMKKKKIKEREKKHKDDDDANEVIFSLLNNLSSPKEQNKTQKSVSNDSIILSSVKKKKKAQTKTSEDNVQNIKKEQVTEYETESESVSCSSKKIKKTKKSLIEESLRSIRSELFPDCETDSGVMSSSGKKSKKTSKKSMDRNSLPNIKSELFTEYETDSGSSPNKKSKVLMSSWHNDDSIIDSKQARKEAANSSIDFESDSLVNPTKKRKRSISVARGSDEDISTKFFVESIGKSEQKKLRKLALNTTEDIPNGFHVETSPTKKVKKRKKHEDLS